jgi:LEA14-like dessication related protein
MNKKLLKPGLFSALFIALFVALFFESCGFKPLSFDKVESIEVVNVENNEGTLELTITATNANSKPVEITDLNAQININTVEVGLVTQGQPFEIPPKGTHTITVPFNLKLQNNVLAIAAGLSLAIFTDNLEVKINGSASGKYGKIKVPIPINYNEKISTKDVKGLWDN